MLKFLENRPEERSPSKSPIKYLPEMCYGNSLESPAQFQTPHTIFHQQSYVNPFLRFEKQRAEHVSLHHRSSLEPRWTKKSNLSLIEQQKIVGPSGEEQPPKSRYLQSFYNQYDSDPKRFRITRGQFTNFIEKNSHYKSVGPLQGIERTTNRIRDRQKSVWIKPPSKHNEMTASLRYATSLSTTVKSSIAQNSEMLTEKNRIRRNRDHIQKIFRRDLEQRKKLNTSIKFQLPRQGPQHEIYMIDDGIGTRYGASSNKEEQDIEEDLQRFEGRLFKMFK